MYPIELKDLSEPAKIIDTSGFLLKLYGDTCLAEYIIKNDIVLNEKIARESKRMLEEHLRGQKCFLLVTSENFFKVTKKARRLGADKTFSTHLAAVSCYTQNPTLGLLGELYNKINKPAVPTRVFSNRDPALEWLLEQVNSSKKC